MFENLTLKNRHKSVGVTFSRFPAGETHVRINDLAYGDGYNLTIQLDYKGDGDLIALMLLVDAIRRQWPDSKTLRLCMPYFPYARQDRVCNQGESLSVKVVADLINSMKFQSVQCWDLHSEVTGALINNLEHISQKTCALPVARIMNLETVVVSPDAGADKKARDFVKTFGFKQLVRADKIRNVSTGEITGTVVHCENVGEANFLILDDICDGGRTFIELAKKLKSKTDGRIFLYVTHGIFSNGYAELGKWIDHIYTANLLGEPNPLVTVV